MKGVRGRGRGILESGYRESSLSLERLEFSQVLNSPKSDSLVVESMYFQSRRTILVDKREFEFYSM